MVVASLPWKADQICIKAGNRDVPSLAATLYERTCRTNFDAPGFCLLNLGRGIDSQRFRETMVALKHAMAAIHQAQTANTLIYLSAARFDQQISTRAHLDGGPEECFLMLGYEPSPVESEVAIIDYAHCAWDLGLTPQQFWVKHNPMFQTNLELLEPYATRILCFQPNEFQILCINNSSAPYSPEHPAWQGTLHLATILTPDESQRRVIDSTMIAPAPAGAHDAISDAELKTFLTSTAVRRSGYDKRHLEDDQ
ncbi:MAG: hypothetical protein ACTHK7_17265 [Aureliella sp.]